MPTRPLSPHLSVYKFRYTMVTSILNRFTGAGLSVGLLLMVYWLTAVAGGPVAQARAARILSLPVAKLFYVGLVITFSYHLIAGIRHLVWDTGRGLEKSQARRSAWWVAAASVALMLVIIYCAWLGGGHPR
ncbi:MAG TPA: succinate dehydrogenase, cytochrome b556 subunit [Steroidobacteraceae bacterium]